MKERFHYPLPRDEVKSIRQAIQKIRFAKEEYLYVFKGGKQILRFIGDESQVNIPEQYLFQLPDTVVVHNHPNNVSFSFEDIDMALFHNISKLIVSTPDFIYEVHRSGKSWDINFEKTETLNFFYACQSIARAELEKLIAQNQMTPKELELKLFHYIWLFFFNKFSIQYVQKKHPK